MESQTDPTATIITREDYINAYPQDHWLGPIWSVAQKPHSRGVESQREIGNEILLSHGGWTALLGESGRSRIEEIMCTHTSELKQHVIRLVSVISRTRCKVSCIKVEIKRLIESQITIIGQHCTMMYRDMLQIVNLAGRTVQT